MTPFKRKCFSILAFIVLPLFVLGCGSSKEEQSVSVGAEAIKLNSGAILKSEEGDYKLYNYEDGEYSAVETQNKVLAYDNSSSGYICIEDNKHYVIHDNKKYEIQDENYTGLKLSKDAKYISYFVQDNGYKLKIFDIVDDKEIERNSDVSISGTLYDWYDGDTLVYYGVSDEGTNGLFTYNIKEDKEELLYKIKQGYLAYLKGTVDNILFLQITLENSKNLMIIDKDTKEVKILTSNIDEVKDVIVHDKKIYFTGRVKSNSDSLYEIDNGKVKRLIFDFPVKVETDKGLREDNNGNILFVGSNDVSSREEQIYSYSSDGSVSTVSNNSTDYVFLDYRN